MSNIDHNKGFGLIEVIVAIGLWSVLAAVGVTSTVGSLRLNRQGAEETAAVSIATEGLESVRAIRKQGWNTPFLGTDCTSGCGVGSSSGTWIFSGPSNVINKYTRTVFVTQAQRDGSGNLVGSGGTLDPETYKVTSQVSWNRGIPPINNTVSVVGYLNNYTKSIIGDWSNPSVESVMNLTGGDDVEDLMVIGNYLYLLRPGATDDLLVVDVSDTSAPAVVGSLGITGSGTSRMTGEGNYLYITDSDNAGEMKIINITNPLSPTLQSSFNAAGNSNGVAVAVVGNTVYLGRSFNGGDPEIVVIDVSDKSAPALLGSLQLSDDANDMAVVGNYAFIASSDNGAELMIVDVTNPASPALTSTLNLSGNNNGVNIVAFGNTAMVGRSGGSVSVVDVTNKLAPSLLATYAGSGGNIEGMSMGNDNKYLFMATTAGSAEFQVVDVTNPATPSLLGSENLTNNPNSVFYSADKDRAFIGSSDNAEEVIILEPL